MTFTARVIVTLAVEIDSEEATVKSASYLIRETWQKSKLPWKVEGLSNNLGAWTVTARAVDVEEIKGGKA